MATTIDFAYACRRLGLDQACASDTLHDAKYHAGLKPDDDCEFDLDNGDILYRGELIGNLND